METRGLTQILWWSLCGKLIQSRRQAAKSSMASSFSRGVFSFEVGQGYVGLALGVEGAHGLYLRCAVPPLRHCIQSFIAEG